MTPDPAGGAPPRYDAGVTEHPGKRKSDTHPLWARVLVGLVVGTLIGGLSAAQLEGLGSPVAMGAGVLILGFVVYLMVKSKKVWSVFRVFEGL